MNKEQFYDVIRGPASLPRTKCAASRRGTPKQESSGPVVRLCAAMSIEISPRSTYQENQGYIITTTPNRRTAEQPAQWK